jgi:hypothetical protein
MGEIITLYHAGYQQIPEPDIEKGRSNADFGRGFYLSDNGEFAGRWMREMPGKTAYVNSYELDLTGLTVKRLTVDREWLSYITANRRGLADLLADVDVITGPIANDTLYDTMGIFTSGVLSDEESLSLLSVGPSYTQVVIKSRKAAKALKFLGARIIPDKELSDYAACLSAEEKEYQKEIAAIMENF